MILVMKSKMGTLYVVALPIGHRKDITLRAIEVLQTVDRIAAEDTRHSLPLLKHFSIDKPMLSLHNFNEHERLSLVLNYLESGESIALISDAGTPLISDPGFPLVCLAKKKGIQVVPIPGPCALIAALSAAGLPTDRFTFEGFLPAKSQAKLEHLKQLSDEPRTMIFYESPHRLLATLEMMADVFGKAHEAVIARELTKIHEHVFQASLGELVDYYQAHPEELRGEIVLLVAGMKTSASVVTEVIPEKVLAILLNALPLKQAVSLASEITGERKNILYKMALHLKT